jgi:hypothetical protein
MHIYLDFNFQKVLEYLADQKALGITSIPALAS